jgi:integrating conjugative element membrane protein (TIGR03745 family)
MTPFFRSPRSPLRTLTPALALMAAGCNAAAQAAGLPVLQPPSQGAGTGILQTLQNYGYDIVMLVSLLVIASMFIGVCYHAYNSYSEIHTGRKTWGEFGLTVAVGAMLLVLGIWLLTNATSIL